MLKNHNLTIKTLIYISGLSIITLIALWILQIILLDYTYERYQIETIKKVAELITDDQLQTVKLEDYADEYNLCIENYKTTEKISYNLRNQGCILDSKTYEINKYKKELLDNKDLDYLELVTPDTKIRSIIYEVALEDGTVIFLNSTLEDESVASAQLRNQLVYIIIILIILSIIVSIFISRRINKPILEIIDSAKELGKGNFNVEFKQSEIAELNELSEVLTVAASEMNKTDELRRDLLANVSHDLKTPLTMIKAYAEKVKDLSYKDKEKMDSDLNVIIRETDRLNSLVNDLLEMSKLDAKKDEQLNIEEYDLIESLNDILTRYDIVIEKNGYKFEIDIPDQAIVHADRSKMEQVIYNLINNAIEHTGDDLVVKIRIENQKDGVVLFVTDTGKGIPKEEIPLVWNRYYTKEKRHKRNVIGSGIGLSIVKKILDKHNFIYGIESRVNRYTTFYVIFHK